MTDEEFLKISEMYNEQKRFEEYLKILSQPTIKIFIKITNGKPYSHMDFKSEKIDCTDELKEIINSDIKKYLSSVRGNFEGIKITMEGDIND